jgi:acetylornithine deacetylase
MEQIVQLLKELISTPSFSREEGKTADLLEAYLQKQGGGNPTQIAQCMGL